MSLLRLSRVFVGKQSALLLASGARISTPTTTAAVLSQRWSQSDSVVKVNSTISEKIRDESMSEQHAYWKRQLANKRPMSPFLTVYNLGIVSGFSLTFRISGVALYSALIVTSCAYAAMPYDFPYYIAVIKSLGIPAFIFTGCKLLLTWPLIYHMCNGVRHLAWDAGLGFPIATVYKTGYFVSALATIIALWIVTWPGQA